MTYARLDSSSAALVVGDVVCNVADAHGNAVVTKATPAARGIAGRAWGILKDDALAPGARGKFFDAGDLVPASYTGLTSSGFVRVSSGARCEVVGAYVEGDSPMGKSDSLARLLLEPEATVGEGVGGDPAEYVLPAGSTAAAINAAVVTANAAYVSTGRIHTVRVQAGECLLETAIVMLSGVRLVGAGGGTTVFKPDPAWVPDVGLANDPTNALVLAQGQLDAATLDTTLTTAITPGGVAYYGAGSRKVSVAAVGTLADDQWIAIHGFETGVGQNPGGTNGSLVICDEMCKVDSIDALVLTLNAPTILHHVTENGGAVGDGALWVRRVVPRENFCIEGIRFDASGRTFANAITLDYCVGAVIERCEFTGFSRAAIEGRKGTRDSVIEHTLLDGELNCGVYLDSAMNVQVLETRSSATGLRHHANGNINALIYTQTLCTNIVIDGFSLHHACIGVWLGSFREATLVNGIIDDMDVRDYITQTSDQNVGVGIHMGYGELDITTWMAGLVMSNITCTNCRSDPATSVIADRARIFTIFYHDCNNIAASDIEVINDGLSHLTTLDGDNDYYMGGLGFQDCGGSFANHVMKGVEYAFAFNSGQSVKFRGLEIVGPPGGGGSNPVVALWFNQDNLSSLEIIDAYLQGGIYFGPDFSPANNYNSIHLQDMSFDGVHFNGPLVLAKNTTGGTRVQGDVVVFDPAAAVGTREVDTPTGNGDARACIVAMAAQNTIADNAMLFVAPANTYADAVKVDGVVAVGDLLETSAASVNARVNNSPAAYVALGRAMSSKGAGVAAVKVVPT
jgi:hypothetical protein